ncbi:hypothetical protein MRB53_041882 [Persea americana]|nr:hypothetical protein MRB53_041882 [Persea americana]
MKFFENYCTFGYPWHQVSAAHWQKYPNEKTDHVVAVDTLRTDYDPIKKVLRVERLITCRQSAPRWILKLVGGTSDSYVREVSEVSLQDKSLTLMSTNLTFSNIMSVQETVRYIPDPDSPLGRTMFFQDARITAYGALSRFANGMMEDFTIERFRANASRGRAVSVSREPHPFCDCSTRLSPDKGSTDSIVRQMNLEGLHRKSTSTALLWRIYILLPVIWIFHRLVAICRTESSNMDGSAAKSTFSKESLRVKRAAKSRIAQFRAEKQTYQPKSSTSTLGYQEESQAKAIADSLVTRAGESSEATKSKPRRSVRIKLHREESQAKSPTSAFLSPDIARSARLQATISGSGHSSSLSRKTLILDLDETLIHSLSKGGTMSNAHMVEVKLGNHAILYHVHKRPHCDHFLDKVSLWYDVVVFTASVQEYADPVIDWLEEERKVFKARYYRQHCTYRGGAYMKDLSLVQPDLSRAIIVDNSPLSYKLNTQNAIPIEGWISDPSDNDLLYLIPVLKSLRMVKDVRSLLSLRTAS